MRAATPLHLFLGSGDEHDGITLQLLLRKILTFITDINSTDDSDLTPLHHLLLNADMPKTFTLLLRHGADPLKQSRIGAMPIHLMVHAGRRDCILAARSFLVLEHTRDEEELQQVLETIGNFNASDASVINRRVDGINRSLRATKSRLREEHSQRAGLSEAAHG